MPRPPGLPKTGGRKAGTPNRNSLNVKEQLAARGVDVIDKLLESIALVPAERQFDAWAKLAEYVEPKRKAVEFSGSVATDARLIVDRDRRRLNVLLEDPQALDAVRLLETKLALPASAAVDEPEE